MKRRQLPILRYGRDVAAPLEIFIEMFKRPANDTHWFSTSELCSLGIKVWDMSTKSFGDRLRWPAKGLGDGRPGPNGDVGARDAQHFADGLPREPSFGHDSDRNRCFFEPPENSRASLRISASIGFLPSSRCKSRTCPSSDQYSEAGTTGSSDCVALNAP
jgi:hypothetical protein